MMEYYYIINIIISTILVYILYQISKTLKLMHGVLDIDAISSQSAKRIVSNSRTGEKDQIPEPVYVGRMTQIDESVYVTKVSSENLIQNPNKNIGNITSVKNDIDEDINKLKELKKGK